MRNLRYLLFGLLFLCSLLVLHAQTTTSYSVAVTVNGSGFQPGATVNLNGSPLATTFISSTQLSAVVPSADLPGITVTNPNPPPPPPPPPPPSSGNITRVQQVTMDGHLSGGLSNPKISIAPVAKGDLIVVAVVDIDAGQPSPPVSDSVGNLYNLDESWTGHRSTFVNSVVNVVDGVSWVQLSIPWAHPDIIVSVYHSTTGWQNSPLDQHTGHDGGYGSNPACTSGPVTTTQASELLLGWCFRSAGPNSGNTWTVNAPWSATSSTTDPFGIQIEQVVSAVGSYAPAATFNSSPSYEVEGVIATYKPR